jgi:hypothetical protein
MHLERQFLVLQANNERRHPNSNNRSMNLSRHWNIDNLALIDK